MNVLVEFLPYTRRVLMLFSSVVWKSMCWGAVYWFRASDGKLVDQFRFKGEASIAHKTSSAQHMTIRHDSSLLAFVYGFKMYIFDCKTKKEIFSRSPGHLLPGPLAFSPDSSLIATSDLRQGGKINIWPVPSQ